MTSLRMLALILSWDASQLFQITATLCLCSFLLYVIYMRNFHPLAKYPGPIFASLSNLFKAYYVFKLTFHEKLLELHQIYGPIVRVGPSHLHCWDSEAIAPIYKGGRTMSKSEFYDAFTAFNPNLFGGRNHDIHALRRRQLAHGFSQTSVQKLEPLIEEQMQILKTKLYGYAKTGEAFDLKNALSLYVLDILGEVAFGKSFDVQKKGESEEIHAIENHLLLSGIIGELPLQWFTKMLSRFSPIPWMRHLMISRNRLKEICAQGVKFKMTTPSERPDLLRSLVTAVDPETKTRLTEQEINSEAFAVLVAGSHSTAGTMGLLFWYLIQNPGIMKNVQQEILTTLGPLQDGQVSYPIAGLESSLRYTMACVRENFRISPVFTMPLWRRVDSPAGIHIGQYHIPQGAIICISNYVLHHNPAIWGPDHNIFHPGRWLDDNYNSEKSRILIPFSVGPRQCIGRNLAMTNILKSVTTLLAIFDFESLDLRPRVAVRSSGIGEMEGEFLVKVSIKNPSNSDA